MSDPVNPYDIGIFPTNIVAVLRDYLLTLSSVDQVFARPLRPEDPHRSVGIVAGMWTPEDYNIGQHDPATAQYTLAIQALTKNTDEQEGIAHHTVLGKNIRHMLYRDPAFRVALSGLTEAVLGTIERVQRWGVRTQRFRSNEISGAWLYLTTTEFWVETEQTPTV